MSWHDFVVTMSWWYVFGDVWPDEATSTAVLGRDQGRWEGAPGEFKLTSCHLKRFETCEISAFKDLGRVGRVYLSIIIHRYNQVYVYDNCVYMHVCLYVYLSQWLSSRIWTRWWPWSAAWRINRQRSHRSPLMICSLSKAQLIGDFHGFSSHVWWHQRVLWRSLEMERCFCPVLIHVFVFGELSFSRCLSLQTWPCVGVTGIATGTRFG